MRYTVLAFFTGFIASGCQHIQVKTIASSNPSLIVKSFLERATSLGLQLPSEPTICEWTRPSILSWRREKSCIALSNWDHLPVETRSLITQWADGGEGGGKELFVDLFRWLFIPHEMTHAFQDMSGFNAGHAASERKANDVAVAFFMASPESARHLAALESTLKAASSHWASIPTDPNEADSYFNQHYDDLTQNPAHYAAFQLRYMLDSMARREKLSFESALRAALK